MNYASLNIAIRRRLDDSYAKKATVADVGEVLDEAAKFFQGELGILRNRVSLSLVDDQRQYTLPTTVQKIVNMTHMQADTGREIGGLSIEQFRARTTPIRRQTYPDSYCQLESEGVILLNPIPDTSAGTTTLNGSHNSSVTTLTVVSTTGFPTEGRVIVDSEVISYNSTTATTFAGCTRAMEGSTAASHNTAATVTERDLVIDAQVLWSDRQMNHYYTTGTVTMAASTTVEGSGTTWNKTDNVAVGDYFGICGSDGTANSTTTEPLRWYKVASVTDADTLELDAAFAGTTGATQNYIISSPNPFPNWLDGALKAYSMSALLKKYRDFDAARMEWAAVERALQNARKNRQKSDDTLRAHSIAEGGRGGRMPLWVGTTRVT